MNILLINHYAGSPQLGMEYRPFYMAKSLAGKGHEMFILAADNSHLRNAKPLPKREVIESVEYWWLKSHPYYGNGFSRVINIFSFLYEAIKKADDIIQWSTPDVIIASSTYPLDNYLAHYLAKKCGARVVYEVHDLWPLSPMEIGGLSKYHPFILLLQLSENYAYRNCHQVISMLPNTIGHMLDHGLSEQKYNYIPNGVYIENIQSQDLPKEHTEALYRIKSKEKQIVGYAGGHAKSNALHFLLEAAQKLPHIEFVLVGDGEQKEKLVHQAFGLDNVTFLPTISKLAIPSFLSHCDILTLVCNDSSLYRFGVSPNKIFDYMLAKKPIVQLLNTEFEPVSMANAGFSAPNLDEYMLSLKRMAEMPFEQQEIFGKNGYSYVLEHHEYSKLAEKFIEVCEK